MRLSGHRDTVIEREEKLRLILESTLYTLVDIASRLKKYTDVLLKKSRSPTIVDARQIDTRYRSKVNLVLVFRRACEKGPNRTRRQFVKVNEQSLPLTTRFNKITYPFKIPDVVNNLFAKDTPRLFTRNPLAKFFV